MPPSFKYSLLWKRQASNLEVMKKIIIRHMWNIWEVNFEIQCKYVKNRVSFLFFFVNLVVLKRTGVLCLSLLLQPHRKGFDFDFCAVLISVAFRWFPQVSNQISWSKSFSALGQLKHSNKRLLRINTLE
jgi:glucose dehydrogenase